jgi:hypothetical protein
MLELPGDLSYTSIRSYRTFFGGLVWHPLQAFLHWLFQALKKNGEKGKYKLYRAVILEDLR